jgi:hypothetical protein
LAGGIAASWLYSNGLYEANISANTLAKNDTEPVIDFE